MSKRPLEVTTLTYRQVWEQLRALISERDDPVPLLALLSLIEKPKELSNVETTP